MKIVTHSINDMIISEIISEGVIIHSSEDGVDLVGNFYFQGLDRVIMYEESITAEFFDLQNGIAGEILQKFSTYRVRLAIIGDFSKYRSKSLQDFIYESNKGRQINFVTSQAEAFSILSTI